MYCVVEFINDQSVAVVAKAWFVDVNCVMWPEKAKQRDYFSQNNLQPPANTKVYAVRVLKDNLTLKKAQNLAKTAEETDDLSSSERTQLGRGCGRKQVFNAIHMSI
ncbi:unnamed protein product [Schistocephalus solidus]|uniref:PINc domain-containing protein n=1 Tax=Schistocephalus solidus TaxID=70667 RepID=A0A183SH28_SCHSO|nr:unnamed protein product [Schistocephalus solidus]